MLWFCDGSITIGGFVPSKIVFAPKRMSPDLRPEDNERGASCRIVHAVRLAQKIRRGQAEQFIRRIESKPVPASLA